MAQAVQVHASASLRPSQPGILRSKSNSDMSTTSSEFKTSTITFAPLPCVEARKKRRNSRPIGIAGRAELLRRTRRQFDPTYEDNQMLPDDDEVLPIPDVGKLVRGLWRTVSRLQKNSSGREVSRPPNTATVVEGEREEEWEGNVSVDEVTWPPLSNSSSTAFPRKDDPH